MHGWEATADVVTIKHLPHIDTYPQFWMYPLHSNSESCLGSKECYWNPASYLSPVYIFICMTHGAQNYAAYSGEYWSTLLYAFTITRRSGHKIRALLRTYHTAC